MEIHWLPDATLQALQRELRHNDFHVFHYIGHGGYDRASEDGVLALEDGSGRSRLVSGMELGTILADEMTLRLAVLNACEGARSSVDDPFSGVATSLVRREIPAVVAMQLEITDRAAITFASELYAALADGYAVDAALAEARKAIFADENEVEWATPVLFMRVPDGRIFDVEAPANVHEPVPEPEVALIAAEEQALEPVTDVVPEPVLDEPVVPEPETEPAGAVAAIEVAPVKVPGRLVAALAASTAVLAVAVVYPWDNFHDTGRSFVNAYFGQDGTVSGPKAGVFTALSPVVVVLLAAIASIMVVRARRLPLAAGLLVACGLAASAKYLGLVGRVVETPASRVDSTRRLLHRRRGRVRARPRRHQGRPARGRRPGPRRGRWHASRERARAAGRAPRHRRLSRRRTTARRTTRSSATRGPRRSTRSRAGSLSSPCPSACPTCLAASGPGS